MKRLDGNREPLVGKFPAFLQFVGAWLVRQSWFVALRRAVEHVVNGDVPVPRHWDMTGNFARIRAMSAEATRGIDDDKESQVPQERSDVAIQSVPLPERPRVQCWDMTEEYERLDAYLREMNRLIDESIARHRAEEFARCRVPRVSDAVPQHWDMTEKFARIRAMAANAMPPDDDTVPKVPLVPIIDALQTMARRGGGGRSEDNN